MIIINPCFYKLNVNKINFYSEKIEHCHKCNYNRSISDARNEKINDLI